MSAIREEQPVREEQPERDVHPMQVGRAQVTKRAYDSYEELKKDFQTDYSFKVNLGQDGPAGEEILNVRQLPEDRNDSGSDLDVNDHDAQIARCDERIPKRCIPRYFEEWNDEHVSKKQKREETCPKCPQKDGHVALRMYELEKMMEVFEEYWSFEAVANVRAVFDAYDVWTLKWDPGLVTYWAKGKRLCMPRSFVWDEFELIQDEYGRGDDDVWVEAVDWNSSLC